MRISRSQLHNIIAETLEQDDVLLRKIKQKFNEEWIKNFFIAACQKTILSGDDETSAYWEVMNFLDVVHGEFGRITPHIRKSLTNYCYGCLYSLDEAGVIDITSEVDGTVHYFVLTDDTLSNLVGNFNLDEGYYKDDIADQKKYFEQLIINYLAEDNERPSTAEDIIYDLFDLGRKYFADIEVGKITGVEEAFRSALSSLVSQGVVDKSPSEKWLRLSDDFIDQEVEDFNLDESKIRNGTLFELIESVYPKHSLKTYFINQIAKVEISGDGHTTYNFITMNPINRIKKMLVKREGKSLDEIANLFGYSKFSKYTIPSYVEDVLNEAIRNKEIIKNQYGWLSLPESYFADQTKDFNLDESLSKDELSSIKNKYNENWIKDFIVKECIEILAVDEEGSPPFWSAIRSSILKVIMSDVLINYARGTWFDNRYEISDYIDDTLLDLQDKNVVKLNIVTTHGTNRIYTVQLTNEFLHDQTKEFSLDESTQAFQGYDRDQILKAVIQQYDENWVRDYVVKECIFDLANENDFTSWVSLQSEILSMMSDNRGIFVTGRIPFPTRDEIRSYLDKTLIHLAKKKIFELEIDNNTIDRRHRIFSVKLSEDYLAKETDNFSLDEVRAVIKDIILESSDVDWDRFYKYISDKLVNYLDEDVVVAAIVGNPITFHRTDGSTYMPDVRRELEVKVENEMFKNWDTTHDNTWMNDRSFMKSISAEIIQTKISKIIEKLANDKVIIFEEDDPHYQYAKVSPDYIENQTADFNLDEGVEKEDKADEVFNELKTIYTPESIESFIINKIINSDNHRAANVEWTEYVMKNEVLKKVFYTRMKNGFHPEEIESDYFRPNRFFGQLKVKYLYLVNKYVDTILQDMLKNNILISDVVYGTIDLSDGYLESQTKDFNLDESAKKENKAIDVFRDVKTVYTPEIIKKIIISIISNAMSDHADDPWLPRTPDGGITQDDCCSLVKQKIFNTRYYDPITLSYTEKLKYLRLIHVYISDNVADMQEDDVLTLNFYGDMQLSDKFLSKEV